MSYAEHMGSPVGYNPAFLKRVAEKSRLAAEHQAKLEMAALKAKADEDRRRAEAERSQIEMEARKNRESAEKEYRELNVVGHTTISAKAIIANVAARTGVSVELIIGRSRKKAIVAARHLAIREVADIKTNLSLPQIGGFFNRDHTTILHALSKTRKPGQAR